MNSLDNILLYLHNTRIAEILSYTEAKGYDSVDFYNRLNGNVMDSINMINYSLNRVYYTVKGKVKDDKYDTKSISQMYVRYLFEIIGTDNTSLFFDDYNND